MLTIRKSSDRGHFDRGWLDSYHTFSFGEYHDPRHTHFRALRVINQDVVAAGQGFGMHPHTDMEILTWMLSGSLQHNDSMGNGEVIRPGDLQHMSAGTGVLHSEFNPSQSEPAHLLQIWIMPHERGLSPGYSQKHFDASSRMNRLALLASPDGASDSITINQDASLFAAILERDRTIAHSLADGRHAWLQVIRGRLEINGETLDAGDALAASDESRLEIAALAESEFLLFDLD